MIIEVIEMLWKQHYIVGFTVISMLFTMPLASAAEDDVVVFGGQYDESNNEPVSINVEPPAQVIEETPAENVTIDSYETPSSNTDVMNQRIILIL